MSLSRQLLIGLTLWALAPGAVPAVAEESAEAVQADLAAALDDAQAGDALLQAAEAEADPAARQERLAAARARWEAAHEKWSRVLGALEQLELPAGKKALVRQLASYNLACARARLGRSDAALEALEQALAAGYDDLERLAKDPSLAALREEERFRNLLERAQARLQEQARAAAREALAKEALFPFQLEATTLEGKPLRLSDLRGKVVIVDVWGTWCPPCRAEIPHFVELQRELGERLVVIGLTWEQGQTGPQAEATVKRFAAELGVNYPLVMATGEDLARIPDLNAFPTTLFLDKQGRVRAREVGYRDLPTLRRLVDALLEEPAPADPSQERPVERF